jgi:8-oxo-dGTP pyrophosphatase MutT (NUDIX family)
MIDDMLSAYAIIFPDERGGLALLHQQIAVQEKLNDRNNFHGHITGSAIILSPDKKKVLLIHHKLFNRWLQPGGHWETDEEASPLEAAQREGEEETGVKIAEYLNIDANPLVPIDIDTHEVPARPQKGEPVHYHHDIRYVFVAKTEELNHQEAEVNAAAWFDLNAPETKSVSRVIAKLRHFGFAS